MSEFLNFNLFENSFFWVFIFCVQIVLVSFLSKKIYESLFQISWKFFHSKQTSVYLVSFIFLPGTFIHEMCHVLATVLMGGRVGAINLWPEVEGNHIKMGTAEVEVMDVFRNSIVGTAPLVFGSLLLIYISSNFFNQVWWLQIVFAFFIFQISNSMFLSPSDLKEVKDLFLILLVITGIAYLYNFSVSQISFLPQSFSFLDSSLFVSELKNVNLFFGVTFIINLLFLLFAKLIKSR
jgi:hypothetical protein